MLDFTGKAVLVTGGGAGIGLSCARAFARQGATVFIAEMDPERCEKFTDGKAIQCDVTKLEELESLVRALSAETGGKLDILVNNVGHFLKKEPFSEMALSEVHEIVGLNLISLMNVTHMLMPLLTAAAPGSSIVSLTSIEAYRGIPDCAAYAAAKTGIIGFTKSLALELAPLGIRVNDIAPETTNTPQAPVDSMIPAENRHHVKQWVPLGRFGDPDDCAGAALYLASPLASWVTGTAINVDGGSLAAGGWVRDVNGTWTNMPIVTGNGLNA